MGYLELFDAFFGISTTTAVNCVYKPTSDRDARQAVYAVQFEDIPGFDRDIKESLKGETNTPCVELDDGFKRVSKSKRSHSNKMPSRNTNCSAMDVMVTEGSMLTSTRQKRPITADVTVDVKTNLSDASIAYYEGAESETSGDPSYENEYPQFELDCMQHEKHDEAKIKSRKSRSILRKFLRCLCPSKVANISSHCSMQIDDVTTLHVLRGDGESDSGTCNAVRALRRRH